MALHDPDTLCIHDMDSFLHRCEKCGVTRWQLLDPRAPGIGEEFTIAFIAEEVLKGYGFGSA